MKRAVVVFLHHSFMNESSCQLISHAAVITNSLGSNLIGARFNPTS
jgi:hypothetical protein